MLHKQMTYTSVLGLALGMFLILPTEARADLHGFRNISNLKASHAGVGEAQFSVSVQDNGSNQALFRFVNTGPVVSSISNIYFDDADVRLLQDEIASIVNGPGVAFSPGASPSHLLHGNTLSPAFVRTARLLADADPGPTPNGIDPGEWLTLILDLQPTATYEDLLEGLNTQTVRIGLKGLSIGAKGGWETYVNTTPVPGAALLGLIGLSAAGLKLRGRV